MTVAGVAFIVGIGCVITGGAQKSDANGPNGAQFDYSGLWGTKLQLLGLAIFIAGALLTYLTWRLLTRKIPPRPPHFFQPHP